MTRHFLGVALFLLLGMTAWSAEPDASGGTVGCGDGADFQALWIRPSIPEPGDRVAVELAEAQSYPVDELVPFRFVITSDQFYERAIVQLTVNCPDGTLATTGELVVDLQKGANSCQFEWDASSVAPGAYAMHVAVNYTTEEDPAQCYATLERVSGQHFREQLEEVNHRLAALRERIGDGSGPLGEAPYTDLRLRIAEDFVARGRSQLDVCAWNDLHATLTYLHRTAAAVEASMVFGGVAPALAEPVASASLAGMELRDGQLYSGDVPVFLFGAVVEGADMAAVSRLRRLGLNFAVLSIGPKSTLAGPKETSDFQGLFAPIFETAKKENVSLAVQLAPQAIGGWVLDAWPDLMDEGYPDLTHPGMLETFERHLDSLLPFLSKQAMLNSVSIADQPKFKFNSEFVRQQFVDQIQEWYPDRQLLNQAWRAHLADYDEISIWDETAEEWNYQNRRAYQFDWQSFHRSLVSSYFDWAQAAARSRAPALRLLVTMPETAFELGESRHGANREAVARMLDINACSATSGMADQHYALRYPAQTAMYTLMRSMAPEKPLFNLEYRIEFDRHVSPGHRAAYVRTALWESVMNGLSAGALASDSPVFDHPESLEAFAVSCLDFNRLAPIVAALQQADAPIMILFSESSKIYDEGNPHLESAWFAFEGCSFAGYRLRFITEAQCVAGELDQAKVLVIPQTPAVSDSTFERLTAYVDGGGTVARVGTPIPYNERGESRHQVLRPTGETVLVRGMNLPTEYLHAMDAAMVLGSLPKIPRPVNGSGYPMEGMRTHYVEFEGQHYLYMLNIRKEPLLCHLAGMFNSGHDLLLDRAVSFPMVVPPLDPMLIRLDSPVLNAVLPPAVGDAAGES